MARNLFTRKLNWLFEAVGLQEPTLPVELATDDVLPVVDVFQGGFGSDDEGRQWTFRQTIVPENTFPPTNFQVFSEQQTWMLLYVGVEHVTPTNGNQIWGRLESSTSLDHTIYGFTLPIFNRYLGQGAIFGSPKPFAVPPGWRYDITIDGPTGPGEEIIVSHLYRPLPQGFRPW